MDIRSKYFGGRQISLLVSVQGCFEGKAPSFVVRHHSNNLRTNQKNLMWVAELDEDGVKSGIHWRKVVNEYVADYSV